MANIGIDLGTTNSLVGVFENGSVKIIPNALGEKLTPSIVSIDDSGEVIIGRIAKERLISHPDKTVSIFKPYTGTGKKYYLDEKQFGVEELSALILRSLKENVESYLGDENIEHCVISVPAYFTSSQRGAVKNAALISGLNVEKIISEPTAAALAYGMNLVDYDSQFMVLDLGGGTFDVSLMEYFEGVFNIHASAGDGYLGGEDFLNIIVESFMEMHGLSQILLSPQDFFAVKSQCETIKRLLSEHEIVSKTIKIKDKEYQFGMSNEIFFDRASDLIEKVKVPIIRVLKDTKTRVFDIDQIVLVGGASRMEIFNNLIRSYFPNSEIITHDPDEAIAKGATIQAEMDAGGTSVKEYVVTDVTPFTLGIEVNSEALGKSVYLPVIERNSPVPISKRTQVVKSDISQKSMKIDIYQGESLNPKKNINIGAIEIPALWDDKSQVVNVQFTYDENGIIHVDVFVDKYEIHKTLVIKNKKIVLTDEEIAAQIERVRELKILPADKAENRLIIAKLERLYEEFIGDERDSVYLFLERFHHALNGYDKMAIHKVRLRVEAYLSQYNFGEPE